MRRVPDIEQEFQQHIEHRVEHYRALGFSAEVAETRARKEFGDYDAILDDCRLVMVGSPHRTKFVAAALTVTVALLAAFVIHWTQSASPGVEDLARELEALEPAPGTALADASSDRGRVRTWVSQVLSGLDSPQDRTRLVERLTVSPTAPHALTVLEVAAGDDDATVRRTATTRLQDYAFQDFSDDPLALREWYARYSSQQLPELLEKNARGLASCVAALDAAPFERALQFIELIDTRPATRHGVDLAVILSETGLGGRLERWHELSDAASMRRAIQLLERFGADRDPLRHSVSQRLQGWLNSEDAADRARALDLVQELIQPGTGAGRDTRRRTAGNWRFLRHFLPHGGKGTPLDLPSGGKRKEIEDDDAPETIELFGTLIEGDAFFFFLMPRVPASPGMNPPPNSDSHEVITSEATKAIRQLSSRSQFSVVVRGEQVEADEDPIVEQPPRIWRKTPQRSTKSRKQAAVNWIESLALEDEGTFPIYCTFLDPMFATIEIANKSKRRHRTLVFIGNYLPVIVQDEGNDWKLDSSRYLKEVQAANVSDLRIHTIFVQWGGNSRSRIPAAAEFWSKLAEENGGTYTEIEHD